ncbi:glycoside hydrolase family 3 C-terminal domain-containing protein [Sphingosinicella sp. BN140058]|uniref:glycoside hydrolase family 3 C-terminal domain-containing protein n=1 Tax=Sphingosinicella sp. BN140058 TaxID=1892855 RepID=UPI0010118FFB|nr:glycoside hydrolase family 3 C-terminal domain-containing protein [Sphingosinicella sp. BN140058]QAY76451.1 glycoside hydrolase family 3 protein [Sphingosinicella sp. BN140058]
MSFFRQSSARSAARGSYRLTISALFLCAASIPVQASPASDPALEKARALVGQLTVEEKLAQLLNVAPAIPRLGIPAYNWWTESLHGALGPLPTTNFPEPIALAASFDTALVHDVAAAISVEVRGLHTLARKTGRTGRMGSGLETWSPNINIFRDPRWGRGQETYGEDPFLTARMGVAFVTGMQGPDPERPRVIATPKHFAVHSGPESTRHEANVFVSAHDLEDTYLPAFRAAIVEGRAGSIMCAYNRIDGQPACASDLLLKDHLQRAWNFTGYVVSDCDAVHDIADNHKYAPNGAAAVAAAMRAGVDSECHGGTLGDTAGLEDRYRDALAQGLLTQSEIDESLVRLFAARFRTGDLAGLSGAPKAVPPGAIGNADHRRLALTAAERAMVLLKNDGILPLAPKARVAVIGPLGDATRVLRGNYSSTLSGPPVSVLEGLRATLGRRNVTLVPYGPSLTDGDRVPESALRTPDGKPGVRVRYFNPETALPARFAPGAREAAIAAVRWQAEPVVIRTEPDIGDRNLALAQVADVHRIEYSGFLVPPETGTYRIGLAGAGATLDFDGEQVVDRRKARWNDLPGLVTRTLVKGRRYPLKVVGSGVNLVWKRISETPEEDLGRAAASADVLVAVVGHTADLETEETGVTVPGFAGGDKTSLDLPADQLALLEQARATGKPLAVVTMNGSPINLAWAKDNAAAILEAWYAGEAGGQAAANILTGRTNPSGRLPLTFYRSVDDLPPFGDYAMRGRTYRYFAGTPVYPFGHGLSYTRFDYAPLTVEPAQAGAEQGMRISTRLTNTGTRAGDEVAQLYLDFPDRPGMPRLALRGFQRVSLRPGETRDLVFDLSPRDLSSVDADGRRMVAAGRYRVTIGSGQPGTGVAGQSASFDAAQSPELPK